MARPRLGISLQADRKFLQLNRALIERAELYEVNPETLWRAGTLPTPLHAEIGAFVTTAGKPVVGHGVLYSLGAATPPPRRDDWLMALDRDQAFLEFDWFSEHLGFGDHGDTHVALPLPLLPCEESIATVVDNLRPLQEIFPEVAFENNVAYFPLGDPRDEVVMFGEICRRSGCGMVLDLHNAYTTCANFDLDLREYLMAMPFADIIELHLSGGSDSDPAWVPSGRVFRVDTHDHAVPEPVWQALEWILPRCTCLRAVVIEWMPVDMDAAVAARYAEDYDRALEVLGC